MAYIVFVVAIALSLAGKANAVEEFKLHTSGSVSTNALIYQIGEEKGFYSENGLHVLTIVAKSQTGIQGLIGGSFDASQILGQGSTAIMQGAPLKIVMAFDTKPLFWLYGGKKVKTLKDLKGRKTLGVSSLGANTDQMTRKVLASNGIDPQRDVIIQGIGTGSIRLAALMSGSLDAAILNPTESLRAQKEGLHELLFYGDYDLNIVSGGIVVSEKLLKDRRDFLTRFLRGTLKAFLWFRSNENETVNKMAKAFAIPKDDALQIYKATLKNYTADGTIVPELQEKIIEFQVQQLKVKKDISPGKLYDFSILKALNSEIRKTGS